MSTSHHGFSEEDRKKQEEMIKRFLGQVDGRVERAYSQGRIRPDDDGDLAYAVAADEKHGTVIIDFGKAIAWIGLKPQEAANLCRLIMQKARQVSKEPLVLEL